MDRRRWLARGLLIVLWTGAYAALAATNLVPSYLGGSARTGYV